MTGIYYGYKVDGSYVHINNVRNSLENLGAPEGSLGIKKLQITEGEGDYWAVKLPNESYLFPTQNKGDLVKKIKQLTEESKMWRERKNPIVNILISELE